MFHMREYDVETAIIIFLSAFLIGSVIFSSSRMTPSGKAVLRPVSSVEGSPDMEMAKEEYSSTSNVVLVNETPTLNSTLWRFSSCHTTRSPEGLKIVVSECTKPFMVPVSFGTLVSSTFEYFHRLAFSCHLNVQGGTVSVEFEGRDSESPSQKFWRWITLTEGESRNVVISDILEDLKSGNETLIHQTWFSISIRVQSAASFTVGDVLVNGSTTTNLMPVAIDFQSLTGRSISEGLHSGWMNNYAACNLSSIDSDQYRLLRSHRGKLELFLPSGNYSCLYGWVKSFPPYAEGTLTENRKVSVDMVLETGVKLSYQVRLPCYEIYVRLAPSVPFVELYVEVHGEMRDFFYVNVPGSSTDSLIIVPAEGNSTTLDIHARLDHYPIPRYLPDARVSDDVSTDLVWRCTISLSDLSIFGMIITPLEIYFMIMGAILLSLLLIKGYQFTLNHGGRNLLVQPVIIPFILLTVSTFLPWAVFSSINPSFGGPQMVLYYNYSLPFSTYLLGSNGTGSILLPEIAIFNMVHHSEYFYGIRHIIISLVLFWIPWLFVFGKFALRKDFKLSPKQGLAFIVPCLSLPLLLTSLYQPTFASLSIGSILVLAAPILFYLNRFGVKRNWQSDRG